MKLFSKNQILLFSLLLFASVSTSYSIGLGLYAPLTFGSGYDEIQESSTAIRPWNTTHSAYGIGFVLDTKVADDKLVNYRLNVGFSTQSNKFDGINQRYPNGTYATNGYDYDMYKISFDNTLGFGFVRTNFMRVWAGPQIRLGWGVGSGNSNSNEFTSVQFGLGFAPVVGINFNIGSMFSICGDMGYRFSYLIGAADYDYTYYLDTYSSRQSDPIYRSEKEFFVNISAMFRIHDVFEHVATRKRR